ncbi:MAG: hypothetical protein ACLFPH_01400 [Bacteroidales bacterium]
MFFDSIDIDEVFRKQFSGFETPPPEEVWDNIESNMTTPGKRSWVKFYQIAALIAIFLVIGGTVMMFNLNFYLNRDSGINTLITEYNQIPELMQPANNFMMDASQEYLAENDKIPDKTAPNKSNSSVLVEDIDGQDTIREAPPEKLNPKFAAIKENKNREMYYATLENNEINDYNTLAYNISSKKRTWNLASENISKLELGTQVSPTISYRNITGSPGNISVNDEQSLITYSGGLNLGYKINKKLKISSGVLYAQYGQTLNNVRLDAPAYLRSNKESVTAGFNGSIGASKLQINKINNEADNAITISDIYSPEGNSKKRINNELVLDKPILQRMEFVKIPLLFEYKLIDRGVGIGMISGINTNFLVGKGLYLQNTLENNKVGNIEGISQVTYSGTLGLSLSYNVTEIMQLSMQPMFDYFLSSFSAGAGKTFPYSFGVYTGLSIDL